MSLIHLSTELRQELKLTPQLLQSMELLQMNSQELLDYLNQVSEENPLVEQTDLSSLHKAYEALRQKVHWINGGLPEDGHGAMPDRGAADRETESLSAFLCDQLERRRLPKPLLALTRYLAELVDEEGRLSQEDLDGVAVTYGPGLVGALLCGVAYRLCPKLPAAYAGEVFGTGILGGLASYPIAAVLMGNTKAALFTFVPSFLISTAVGAAISVLVLSALKRTHVFSSLEGALR